MLFKVSYTRWGRPDVLYIHAESCDSALDYLTAFENWWKEVKDLDINRCSLSDTDYISYKGWEPIVPLGWATRTSRDLPKKYYYKRIRDIHQDYTLLRWAATDEQFKRVEKESWVEISRVEASKIARKAAKEDTSYYTYGMRGDDKYIYPLGYNASDLENVELLCYHNRLRIADYTPEK